MNGVRMTNLSTRTSLSQAVKPNSPEFKASTKLSEALYKRFENNPAVYTVVQLGRGPAQVQLSEGATAAQRKEVLKDIQDETKKFTRANPGALPLQTELYQLSKKDR